MTRDEFIQEYNDTVKRTVEFAARASRAGLLVLENELDQEKIDTRDIFYYGLRFVIDGTNPAIIVKVLSNLIGQEKDKYTRILKNIQKEAVFMIQEGLRPWFIYPVLNSFTDISLKDDVIKEADLANEDTDEMFEAQS